MASTCTHLEVLTALRKDPEATKLTICFFQPVIAIFVTFYCIYTLSLAWRIYFASELCGLATVIPEV